MNKFLTLIRRDMADNRGALVITPLVIAAIVLLLGAFTTLAGKSQFGFDPKDFKNEFSADFNDDGTGEQHGIKRDAQGRVVVTTPEGTQTLDQAIGNKGKAAIVTVMPAATSVIAMIPIGVAGIVVLFLLAGALYEERKDRTILFWKSMPVSDLTNAVAKMVSIIAIGFAIAFAVGMVMQLGSVALASVGMARVGISGVAWGTVFTNVGLIWVVGIVALVTYIGWAMPIYAWFLAVSAGAPKAPFVAAALPLFLAPLLAKILNLPGDMTIWQDPLRRLGGVLAFGNVTEGKMQDLRDASGTYLISDTITEITSSMASPYFWIGLLVAAALVYAASEIRRRRAL
jgi:ABC-2 type transport system permease protein